MMRTLSVFGCIALYVACAFVTPSEANVRAMAKSVMKYRPELSAKAVNSAITRTTGVITYVAASPKATVLVESASKAAKQHVTALTSAAASSVASQLSAAVSSQKINMQTAFTSLIAEETDEALKKQFERIEWAAQKADPRFCRTLSETAGGAIDSAAPTFGDLLALCLARTTGDVSRCGQIDPASAPALRRACDEGLVKRS